MLNFKKFEISDFEFLKKFFKSDNEFSSENTFLNLLVWQNVYNNMWAYEDGQVIIKSGFEDFSYRLPFGNDFCKGMKKIQEFCGMEHPKFWVQEGSRFEKFKELYGKYYDFTENRDAFDYIYLSSNLADLSGKKYHGKRNHINTFSKKVSWEYRSISKENITDIKICAESWYKEKNEHSDKFLLCEKEGINTVLDNMEALGALGGAIYTEEKVIAFTLGSPVNNNVFDINFEKALAEYSEAYTVINNEFAKRLQEFKYINREDDMGLEGLRRAKLSYKPELLIKKYSGSVKLK